MNRKTNTVLRDLELVYKIYIIRQIAMKQAIGNRFSYFLQIVELEKERNRLNTLSEINKEFAKL